MSKEEIKEKQIKSTFFWSDPAVLISLGVLAVFLIVSWVLWMRLYTEVETPIGMPIYFNFLKQYDFVYRYVLPIFGTLVALFHVVIGWFSYNRERLVSYYIIGGAAFVEVLILVTVIYYMIFI